MATEEAVYKKELALTQEEFKKQPKYHLRISSTPTDATPVNIIINGHNFLIKRDADVIVPQCVIETLGNAKVHGLRFDPETNTNIPHEYLRHAFTAMPVQETKPAGNGK